MIQKIALGNDHAGVEVKFIIKKYLENLNYKVINFGTDTIQSVSYPDYALLVSNFINKEPNSKGILICGSGLGISLAANKIKGIRCVPCATPLMAKIARENFDINILGLGARVIGVGVIEAILDTFLNTSFNNRVISKKDALF